VWGDEDDDDVSIDSDNDNSGRLYDFVVAKTNDQEEDVVTRPGFTVHFFEEILSLELTPTLLMSEDELSASCRSTAPAWDPC
jgi:hypothetical protein